MRGDSLPELHEEREPRRHIPHGLVVAEPLGSDMFTTSTETPYAAFKHNKIAWLKCRLTSPVKVMKKGLERWMPKLLYSSCSNAILLSCGAKVKGDEHQAARLLVERSNWASHRP